MEFLGDRTAVADTTGATELRYPAVAGVERVNGLSVIARGGTVVFSIGTNPTASSGWPVVKDQWAILPFNFPDKIFAIGGAGITLEYQWVVREEGE